MFVDGLDIDYSKALVRSLVPLKNQPQFVEEGAKTLAEKNFGEYSNLS